MVNTRRKFLSNFIADLAKIFIAAGAGKQVFSDKPQWLDFTVVFIVASASFMIAFFIHPKQED
ncbi:MAG: hypothetical protein HZA78_04785 [Candidatus Schekmanbacteria bacterium]|nr:hypothetical protein [Candidatus Schekmanbacteria bacterium]